MHVAEGDKRKGSSAGLYCAVAAAAAHAADERFHLSTWLRPVTEEERAAVAAAAAARAQQAKNGERHC